MRLAKKLVFTILFFFICSTSFGQFYNGHQMTFGKNRIQYIDFFWFYYRFDKFDVYYGSDGREIAEYASQVVYNRLPGLERFFEHQLEKRIIFIVYSKQSYFKQSNIGLISGNEETNTGGVTRILDNKVFLYFEGDHKKFEQQIVNAMSEVLLTELLYGGNVRERIATNTLLNIPDWYSKGLFSYLASNWNPDIENKTKDAFEKKRYRKFSALTGEDAVNAGHSFWHFIAETYGENVVPNIIYFTKINRSADEGFVYVLGKNLKELTPEWIEYYEKRYAEPIQRQELPDSLKLFKRPKIQRVFQLPKISPDGKTIAYTTNEMGRYIVWTYDIKTKKRKKIFKGGIKLERINDYSFPLIAWHPGGEILSIVSEEKGLIRLINYTIPEKTFTIKSLEYFDKVMDFSYSEDGSRIVLSAVRTGLVDIFVYRVSSATIERITWDIADDFNPRFMSKGKEIVFCSDRNSDTLQTKALDMKLQETTDLFVYDYAGKSPFLKRVTSSPMFNETKPFEIRKDIFAYLTDENGIRNRQIAKLDSTISYVDTTTHYRFFTRFYPLTNYGRNIIDHNINPKTLQFADIILKNKRYYTYTGDLSTKRDAAKGDYKNTLYRDKSIKLKILKDSLQKQEELALAKQLEESLKREKEEALNKANKPKADTLLIDINNYLFEEEKHPQLAIQKTENKGNKLRKNYTTYASEKNEKIKFPEQRNYYMWFYLNNLVGQVDFGFLNNSYQFYTDNAVYFNPGVSSLIKFGINDLFENYKIVGGIRLGLDFESNEYLLSFENLAGRIDKQLTISRQTNKAVDDSSYLVKTRTTQINYCLSYPFTEASSLRLSTNLRIDKETTQSEGNSSLEKPDKRFANVGLKLEYVFDNTRNLGLNLYEGTRSKIFFEWSKEVTEAKTDLFVIGADVRHYIKIHRTLIFASRLAGSTSFGSSKLMYFLGGVDNWLNFPSSKVPTFDRSVRRNTSMNWVYQTAATNMRGFTQNIRNGNSFLLMNNELRFPVFRYLANRPLNSDFINNFQVVGFFDAGSAWSGLSPKSEKNWYNKTIYPDPSEILPNATSTSVKVIVDNQRSAIVAGYGFGLRSRVLGYFMRVDWAWGIDKGVVLPRIFYFSLSLDF
jgi:hypothetical protein